MPSQTARARVVDFRPIDPKGMSDPRFRAEVAKGINAIHDCVHAGQKAADEKREALATDLGTVKTDVAAIKGAVHTLTELFSNGPPAVKAKLGWKEHGTLVLSIIGAGSGFAFFYKFGAAILAAAHAFLMSVT